ncbi:radical SAM protein [Candidatus Poribacteria bacterium]
MGNNSFLTVDRIEFEVTYRCNSHCKHCQIEQCDRGSQPAAIDKELAIEIIREITRTYSPGSIMTFGGEPLLFPDIVCAIHEAARAGGIEKRQLITNASCPRSEAGFRKVAFRLADSGVNGIHISVDSFHQEYIPLDIVERNVQSFVYAGIHQLKWNPCWVASKEHDNSWNRRTKDILQALSHLPVAESSGNIVQPEGSALTWLRDFMPPKIPIPGGLCGDMPYTGPLDDVRSISAEPDGRVSVCNEFYIGNAHESDIIEMLEEYDPYQIPEMKALLEGGVTELARLAFAKGIKADPGGYYSVCDMCKSIRRELAKPVISAA